MTARRLRIAVLSLAGLGYGMLGWALPLDDEFQVNTTTTDGQEDPDVAMDANGNSVVVWDDRFPGSARVVAQRYNASGVPQGGELMVNATNGTDVVFPVVAMDIPGNFAVAWQHASDDGSGPGIFGRVYNAAGVAQTASFGVNTITNDGQRRPHIDMDDDGDFVIVWEDDTVGNSKRGVRGQRYNAAGAPQGGNFTVSTDADVDHVWPQVALAANGDFIVAWAKGNVGANQDVMFRRYDAAGNSLGGPTQVNVTSRMDNASGVVNNLAIDAASDGSFVVAWNADNFTGPGVPGAAIGILARRYDDQGVPLGAPFDVNTDLSMRPTDAPEVAVTRNGEFAITFVIPDGSNSGIGVQRYFADGSPRGPIYQLNNVNTNFPQTDPDIALDDDGNGIVAWSDQRDADGDDDGVFARRLDEHGVTAAVDFNKDVRGDLLFRNRQAGRNHLWQMDGPTALAKNDMNNFNGQAWRIAAVGDFDRNGTADIFWRNVNTGANRMWLMLGAEVVATRQVLSQGTQWQAEGAGDVDRDGKADLVWRHTVTGQVRVWLMSENFRRAVGTPGTLSTVWLLAAISDFSGDGKADLLFRNTQTGQNRIWRMNRFSKTQGGIAGIGLGWVVGGTGDVNRDGFADIFWRNSGSGANRIWLMKTFFLKNNSAIPSKAAAWDPIGMRDVGGDSKADIVWQNGSTRSMQIWEMNKFNATVSGIGKPDAGLLPIVVK